MLLVVNMPLGIGCFPVTIKIRNRVVNGFFFFF